MTSGPASAGPSVGDGAGRALAGAVLVGCLVALALGVYGRVHSPTGVAITTLGFPSLLEMKAWLTTGALLLAGVQLVTALRMYERIGRGPGTRAVVVAHRASGALAVVLTLPVAFHCLWSLGFGTYSTRVLVHSVLGCAFYGAFVTKMLLLRSRRVPGWALPWAGGIVLATVVALWLTSSLWFFVTRPPVY